jgi:hypothetical protein
VYIFSSTLQQKTAFICYFFFLGTPIGKVIPRPRTLRTKQLMYKGQGLVTVLPYAGICSWSLLSQPVPGSTGTWDYGQTDRPG